MPIISLLKADSLSSSSAKEADLLMRRLLLPMGGEEFYFCPGEKVVILVDLSLPADNETGVNFDIRLAWALLNIARNEGITDIKVCFKPEDGFEGDVVLDKTSYNKLTAIEGVSLVDLSTAPASTKLTDTALSLEKADVYDVLCSADIIISLAKFKSGEGQLFGGAFSNIALAAKSYDGVSFEHKSRAVVDVYSVIAPDLTIVDCVKGQSGFQPNVVDCLVAGSDAAAVDTVLCAIAEIDPNDDEEAVLASQYGMGVNDPADISMFGDDLREIMGQEIEEDDVQEDDVQENPVLN